MGFQALAPMALESFQVSIGKYALLWPLVCVNLMLIKFACKRLLDLCSWRKSFKNHVINSHLLRDFLSLSISSYRSCRRNLCQSSKRVAFKTSRNVWQVSINDPEISNFHFLPTVYAQEVVLLTKSSEENFMKIIVLTTSLEVYKKWWTTEEIRSAIKPWREIAYRF